MDSKLIIKLMAVAMVLVALAAWFGGAAFARAPLQAADFYECPPGNTLVVCSPGTGPPNAECRNVGSGQTTIAPRDCT